MSDEKRTPQPGDWAQFYRPTAEPLEVARVEGDQIWLYFGDVERGPFNAANYTFTAAPIPGIAR